MPTPGDDCDNCFFAVVPPQEAGRFAGFLSCNRNAPFTVQPDNGAVKEPTK
jgi:hypothetical protein